MKLLSFGEIIWDVYSFDNKALGGAPVNFSAYAALLGANAYLASAVGEDLLGKEAVQEIKSIGISTEYISTVKEKQTGKCEVSLDKNGVPTYNILRDVAYDYIDLPDKLPQKFDAICFGTLSLRGENNKEKIKNILADNEFSQIYVDLNIRPPFYSKENIDFCLSNATIAKISDEEMPFIANEIFDKNLQLNDAANAIIEKYSNIKLLLITCGEDGAFCYDIVAKKVHYSPAKKAAVASTVGAGDSFGAAFLTVYYETLDVQYSLDIASKISGFVVSHREAIPKNAAEFIATLFTDEK